MIEDSNIVQCRLPTFYQIKSFNFLLRSAWHFDLNKLKIMESYVNLYCSMNIMPYNKKPIIWIKFRIFSILEVVKMIETVGVL